MTALAASSPPGEDLRPVRERIQPLLGGPSSTIVREFFAALRDPFTRSLRHNTYLWFGVLWGLPIPLFSLGIDLLARDLPVTMIQVFAVFREHPLHFLFLAHPLLFAVVFGAMGSVRRQKDQKIAGLIADLEEHLRLLAAANAELKGLDRLKSEFLANVSHELRTPLVSIQGYSEMILEGRLGPINAKQAEGLQIAGRNVIRLLDLINELLEFSRLQSGKSTFHIGAFDLRDAVHAAAVLLRPRLEEKRLRFEEAVPPDACSIFADRDKLNRVFINLLSNAVKFTPEGGTIATAVARDESGMYRIEVRDTGCGIPAEAHGRVFERFWQYDGSTRRKHGGTGLGLAICKEIVQGHGGRISFESAEGKGTVMRVLLPIGRAGTETSP
ncbi:MAG: HAMP domain-containing histidine kinase [Planctomycetes bacterium]|nr:HAMP domain-containing histidine kinase [Planctomycetota bacterium]